MSYQSKARARARLKRWRERSHRVIVFTAFGVLPSTAEREATEAVMFAMKRVLLGPATATTTLRGWP